jgi:hypothetical protein
VSDQVYACLTFAWKRNCIRTGLSNPPRGSSCYAARNHIFILCLYRKSGTVLQVGRYNTYCEFYACVLQTNPQWRFVALPKKFERPRFKIFQNVINGNRSS